MSTPAVTEQPVPPDEALAWEDAQRTRGGIGAIAAALFTLAGGILLGVVQLNAPHVTLVNALRDATGARPDGPGLAAETVTWFDDKAIPLIGASLLTTIGFVLMVPALGYLYRATAARTPKLPRIALFTALIGPVFVGLGGLVAVVLVSVKAGTFAGGADQSTKAAHDALHASGVITAARYMQQLGMLITGIAFVLISLNAMRVGLLTRFMGIIGMLAGALLVFPLTGGLLVIQCFWLLAVGALILGKWPAPGVPPAWKTGEAHPWPSQQEVREQRQRQLAEQKGEKGEKVSNGNGKSGSAPAAPRPLPRPGVGVSDEVAAEEARAGTPHSSSKKKKRKRR